MNDVIQISHTYVQVADSVFVTTYMFAGWGGILICSGDPADKSFDAEGPTAQQVLKEPNAVITGSQ